MLTGSCHCGSVTWKFEGNPGSATACNCTICRRYGALWIYGKAGEQITTTGLSNAYTRGPVIEYHFCPTCGCLAFYRIVGGNPEDEGMMAVNIRMADEPEAVSRLEIDHFDGLDSFDDLPRDGRRVADMWF
ncbi:GFA family protein [Amaricoccus macauensis]|uniref:GFA family protein n=1 Tax=Amaricoccus macauensis TaxID=57001 RepID=UPI003C7C3B6F